MLFHLGETEFDLKVKRGEALRAIQIKCDTQGGHKYLMKITNTVANIAIL